MPTAATTQTATVRTLWSPLFQRALPNIEGKTFTSVIIEFPPSYIDNKECVISLRPRGRHDLVIATQFRRRSCAVWAEPATALEIFRG
jgi:hypothetical protein